ncbi:MAG: short-chain dehydrogenase [Chitinophagaceae bacterium]|nr:MAG: short-chain dehydrogenase [Chitinophagaceae bacterium]
MISFKKRNMICGLFVKGHRDYNDLKSKNFWRIVPQSQFTAYEKTGDIQLAKIFSGSEFSRLSIAKTAAE